METLGTQSVRETPQPNQFAVELQKLKDDYASLETVAQRRAQIALLTSARRTAGKVTGRIPDVELSEAARRAVDGIIGVQEERIRTPLRKAELQYQNWARMISEGTSKHNPFWEYMCTTLLDNWERDETSPTQVATVQGRPLVSDILTNTAIAYGALKARDSLRQRRPDLSLNPGEGLQALLMGLAMSATGIIANEAGKGVGEYLAAAENMRDPQAMDIRFRRIAQRRVK